MSTQEQGMGLAAVADNTQTAASRTREPTVTLPLRVEKLGIAAPPAHVKFSYTVTVAGMLERIVRGGPEQLSILVVDGAAYAVPAGTLVEIETGELR